MKNTIYCKTTSNGVHSFYLKVNGKEYFLFTQSYRSGVVAIELTDYNFSAFDLKITGFTDEQMDIKLAMGIYVEITKGDNTEYSYVQDKTSGELIGKYQFVSCNDIIKTNNRGILTTII